jgi:WW domain binding protein 11
MPKERTVNPATSALKASKARAIKKSKSVLAHARTEKLARRNPQRIQKQIDALQAERDSNAGKLRPRDKETLERLEREVGAVRKARERLGVKEDENENNRNENDGRRPWRDDRGDGGVLGKRGRDGQRIRQQRESSSETDEDVKDIPMPKDDENMPPIPRRRPNRHAQTNGPNVTAAPAAPAQTVYSSEPQVRNLQKEATARFMPAAVANKLAAVKGTGGRLLEPEEADALEQSGYRAGKVQDPAAEARHAAEKAAEEAEKEVEYRLMALEEEIGEAQTLEEEEQRFRREVRRVEIEDVEDEDL